MYIPKHGYGNRNKGIIIIIISNFAEMPDKLRRSLHLFAEGDVVARYVLDKRTRGLRKGAGYWLGPYVVTREILPTTYEIQGTGLNGTAMTEIVSQYAGHLKLFRPQLPNEVQLRNEMKHHYIREMKRRSEITARKFQKPLIARFATERAPILKGDGHDALDATIHLNWAQNRRR